MASPAKFPWGIAAIIALFALALTARNLYAPAERVPWQTDIAAARQEAARSGKPLFLDFTATWCGPCQSLKTTTWADKSVAAEFAKYVPVQVDIDRNPDLARQYEVDSIPAFFVIDAKDGHLVKMNRAGALDAEDFLQWIRG